MPSNAIAAVASPSASVESRKARARPSFDGMAHSIGREVEA